MSQIWRYPHVKFAYGVVFSLAQITMAVVVLVIRMLLERLATRIAVRHLR